MMMATQPRMVHVVSPSGTAMFTALKARKNSDRQATAFETVVKQWIRLKTFAVDFSVSDSGMVCTAES